jgi:hypothetical protein
MPTIISVLPDVELEYGPLATPRLKITVVDEQGTPTPLVFTQEALLHLAKVVRVVDGQFPGALRGH